MSAEAALAAPGEEASGGGLLGLIERVGNKIPHPVALFAGLIVFVIVLSHILFLAGVSVTAEIAHPEPVAMEQEYVGGSVEPTEAFAPDVYFEDYEIDMETIEIESLLTTDGVRFIFTSFVNNFANFNVVAVIFVAMIGVGVAEEAGLMAALIRRLVKSAPRWALAFIIIFIGGLSSVATDAGYLILIPLGAAAFLSVGRHPLAGLAAAYAGVSVGFAVNVLITPLDALLNEVTNEAIQLAIPGESISIISNLYFAIASTIFVALLATFVTERMIEPRLGAYQPAPSDDEDLNSDPDAEEEIDPAAESRGIRFALAGLLGVVVLIALLTLPPGAPLREPETGDIIGTSPFMDSLIFIISMVFLVAGVAYGIGARTFQSSVDVINGVTRTFAGLAGLVFMLLVISQFIAYFNYSELPSVIAVSLADILENLDIGALPLLIGMILVILILDIIMPGSLPKWAIFAPIFVPLFIRLDVAPQTVLAAYRLGDSPMNVVTPLMVYLPLIIVVAQRYQRDAGIGTVLSLMIPYTAVVLLAWIVFFALWFVLGIPLGPGYPVSV